MSIPCLSTLGAAKYPDIIRDAFPPVGWAIKVFWDTFGDPRKALKFAYSRGCRVFIIQGVWADHKFGSSEVKKAVRNAGAVDAFFRTMHGVTVYYSPWCEHRERDAKVIRKMFAEIRSKYPLLNLINNPEWPKERAQPTGVILPEEHNEFHGAHIPRQSGKYSVDYDGTSCTEKNVQEYKERHSNAIHFCFWIPEFNCKAEADDKTPIERRKVRPKVRDLIGVHYLWMERGLLSNLPDLWVWKSHAENHSYDKEHGNKEDPKANFPVFICTQNVKSVDLVAANGKKFATLKQDPRLGPITSSPYSSRKKGYRFYDLRRYGYELAELARAAAGTAVCSIKVGSKSFKINPAFRWDTFK